MSSQGYYGNVNVDLLHWVPLTASRVLELGCGEGALAAEYKHRNPDVHYTAIEIDPPSAKKARTRVDRLIEGNFETIPDEDIGAAGQYDAIFMGDVLEHLSDPWRALSRIEHFLADEGTFVCCVPNIAHWSALVELMQGRWEYRDSGLFDRTHLRFFTLDSLVRMLEAGGFRVAKTRPRNFPLDRSAAEKAMPLLADLASALGIDRNSFVARANALQYVMACRKKSAPANPIRIHVAAMAPRFLDVRAKLPAEYLQSCPETVVSLTEKDVKLPALAPHVPKIAIVQRPRIGPQSRASWTGWINEARRQGWVIVQEIDDHPELLAGVYSKEDSASEQSHTWHVVSCAHAVQTSTVGLVEAFRARNLDTALFENAVFRLPPLRRREEAPMKVFFGALNRERFSARIAEALNPFVAEHPEVEFVVVHDKAFFEAIQTGNKSFQSALPYDAYLDAMASCHIALMPLEGTYAETFKSDVKFLEASSRGVVSIASPPVYAGTIEHDDTGLLAANVHDWPMALARLVDDVKLRDRLAGNAWRYVRSKRMFAHQVRAREDWYHSLWARRAELDAALLLRHPELTTMKA